MTTHISKESDRKMNGNQPLDVKCIGLLEISKGTFRRDILVTCSENVIQDVSSICKLLKLRLFSRNVVMEK